jgi:hypothetical protein
MAAVSSWVLKFSDFLTNGESYARELAQARRVLKNGPYYVRSVSRKRSDQRRDHYYLTLEHL